MKKQLLSFIFALPFFVNAQFSESFDTGIPATWTVINGGDAANTWTTYATNLSINPHSGARYAGLIYGSTAHSDYLITPQFTVTTGVSDRLVLWGINRGASLAETFDIKISTTTPTASAFTTTIATAVKPATTWTKYVYDLSAYAGQTIYVGFYSSTTDIWFLGLDDIAVTNAASLSVIDSKSNKLNIYPNPVKDILNIKSEAKTNTVNILSFTGQVIKTVKLENGENKVDLSSLPKGNYIVRIEEEGQFKTFKIIKD
ncbi:choice-of-anchor J domain-containing protein [Epilithonimonas sp. UC225_85]|uniref:T9SS type A sorting domain-containing protein n=1 Tax=Epilithonimonas sp. UC225_85 TaxID=3350167 RepID=UPI0036D31DA1